MMRRDAQTLPPQLSACTCSSENSHVFVIPIQSVVRCPIDPSKAIVAQMCAWGSFDFGSSLSSRLLNAPVASQIKVVIVDIAY